jgi:hypothetical protein
MTVSLRIGGGAIQKKMCFTVSPGCYHESSNFVSKWHILLFYAIGSGLIRREHKFWQNAKQMKPPLSASNSLPFSQQLGT